MNQHTFRVLEFDRVKEIISKFSVTDPGKEKILSLQPFSDLQALILRQKEVSEAMRLLDEGSIPLTGASEIRSFIKSALLDSVLTPVQLLDIYNFLQTCGKVKKAVEGKAVKFPLFKKYCDNISHLSSFEQSIKKSIAEDGKILDSASPKLKEIRNRLASCHSKVQDKLQNILRDQNLQKMLQEPIITTREDRYVLPVKQECRSQFPGLVLDQSSSGVTVFMEPLQVVEIGNELRQLSLSEKREIEIILYNLTSSVAEHSDELNINVEVIGHLDLLMAAAIFSEKYNCFNADINEKGYLRLIGARHPLLSGNVVPIDVEVGDKFATLVITGPNTGGKTVTLKTIGLFSLMTLSGLPIPSKVGSFVPFFKKIFADIGDEQSIAQNLSTFSSHLTQITRIIPQADRDSLILLDEIGAGTDPTEGGALAISLLEYFHAKGARTVATTHYSQLKSFAASTPGVSNASVEFDVETLKPTYKVRIGLPGRSCALAISSRLGLISDILSRAYSLLKEGDVSLEKLLEKIEDEKEAAEHEVMIARKSKEEAQKLREEYEKALAHWEEKRKALWSEASREVEDLVEGTSEDLENIFEDFRGKLSAVLEENERNAKTVLEDLKEQWKKSRVNPEVEVDEALKEIKWQMKRALQSLSIQKGEYRSKVENIFSEFRKSIRAKLPVMEEKEEIPEYEYERPVCLETGEKVFLIDMNEEGFIDGKPEGEFVPVRVGNIRLRVPVRRLRGAPPRAGRVAGVEEVISSKRTEAKRELDLRGCTVDEALAETEKFLDDASMANIGSLRIIHGKGTGALRKALQEYFKTHPLVKSFHLADEREGGWGVSIVEL